MTARLFVDTNVLVYRRDAGEREKRPRAAQWLDTLWRARTGRLSMQVLMEFYQTVTRKLQPGLDPGEARSEIRELMAWKPVLLTPTVLEDAWKVESRYELSFWDSLIVAAARNASCRYLLTEDLQDGQDFEGCLVVNPFLHEPTEIDLNPTS